MILTVTNLKGGTSKTTSSAYLAAALAELGRRVLIVDADPQGSIGRWAELADWTIPVRGMPTGRLHVPGVGVARELERGDVDTVVIDTPPTDRDRSIVESAVRAATHVVVPIAPTTAELERMDVVAQLIADVGHARAGGPPLTSVLLTRVDGNAKSETAIHREALVAAGWYVHRPTVAAVRQFRQAWGAPLARPLRTAYGDVAAELVATLKRPAAAAAR